MTGIQTIIVNGKNILLVDCSGIDAGKKDVLAGILQQASEMIAANPPKSGLVITDINGLKYNSEIFSELKAYAAANDPYVKGSALVGLSRLQKALFTAIKALTGRDYYVAADLEDAKGYLGAL